MKKTGKIVCLGLLLAVPCLPAAAGEWTRFRGDNGTGVSASAGLPAEFGPDVNQLWEADVPFGRSSPVVTRDRVFLTATEEGRLVALALDRATGKTVWRSVMEPRRADEFHRDTDSATTTPVTDGKNLYVFFQEYGLVSFDKRGKQRWALELGPFRNFYSIAASPVLAGNTLFMVCDQAEGSFAVAVDKNSGKVEWRVNRPARLEAYSTPVVWPPRGKPKALLVAGSRWVDAYDVATGRNLWTLGDVGTAPVSSPVIAGDTLYVVAPNHAQNGWSPFQPMLDEHDEDKNGALSREEVAEAWMIRHFGWLDTDADGEITPDDWETLRRTMVNEHWGAHAIRLPAAEGKPEKLWNYRKNPSEIASPLVHDGVFYMVESGILTSLDAATGELLKRDRLAAGSPKVYASPVAADGKLYLGTLEGTLYTVRAGGEWETLSSVDFEDEIWATPAIAGNRIYLRTRGKLYAFGR